MNPCLLVLVAINLFVVTPIKSGLSSLQFMPLLVFESDTNFYLTPLSIQYQNFCQQSKGHVYENVGIHRMVRILGRKTYFSHHKDSVAVFS